MSTIEPTATAGVEQAVKAATEATAASVLINMELSKVLSGDVETPARDKRGYSFDGLGQN
jgi:hypothetical protein